MIETGHGEYLLRHFDKLTEIQRQDRMDILKTLEKFRIKEEK